jgi:hypothetical protein
VSDCLAPNLAHAVADLLGDVDDAALEAPERDGVERGMFDPLVEEPRIAENEQIIAKAAVSGGPAKILARSLMRECSMFP